MFPKLHLLKENFFKLDFFKQKYILTEIFNLKLSLLNDKKQIDQTINNYLLFNITKNIIDPIKLELLLEKIYIEHINNNKPLSKIFKRKFFYDRFFKVNKYVLCPRTETEILIHLIVKLIPKKIKSFLDLGTGSGALSIILKNIYRETNITAIDICNQALKIAKHNAKKYKLEINFLQNNWLNNINVKFDLLISNPPYLTSEEIIPELQYDPQLALIGNNNGLEMYEKIYEKKHLFKHIFLEINPKHKKELSKLFKNAKFFKDYNKDYRFLYYKY